MAFIQVNNANFYYELHGSGQPLILIAGYACDHSSWLPIFDKLTKHFQVLIFDNRAIGQTVDDDITLTTERMAHDVMALADQLNLHSPHILGHSMGGSIAQTIAAFYPQAIYKLVILCSTAKWREVALQSLHSTFMMRKNNVDLNLILDSALPWVFGDQFLKNKENIALFKKATLENPFFQTVDDQYRQYKFLEQFDSRNFLDKICSPTLIAYGIEDLLSLPYEAKFLADKISNAQLVEFDCAHEIMFESANKLTQMLIDFLK